MTQSNSDPDGAAVVLGLIGLAVVGTAALVVGGAIVKALSDSDEPAPAPPPPAPQLTSYTL